MILLATFDWQMWFFLLFACLACGFAAAVLFSSNIVRMAFYLVLCLGATSGLFFLAGAEFVGAMQLMIYVGGTLVLLIFGVMLTAQSRFVEMKTRGGDWVLAAGVGGALLCLLLNAAFGVTEWTTPNPAAADLEVDASKMATPIGLAFAGVRVDRLGNPETAGLSGYLLPFVIVSVHLLVVLIGAAYMARTKRYVPGGAAERTAAGPTAADIEARRRGVLVSTLIVLGGIMNVVFAVLHLYLQPTWREAWSGLLAEGPLRGFSTEVNDLMFYLDRWLAQMPSLLWVLAGLFLVNVILLYVLWQWQRWAFFGLLVVPVIQSLVLLSAGVGPLFVVGHAVNTLVPVAILYAALRSGGDRSVWGQLE